MIIIIDHVLRMRYQQIKSMATTYPQGVPGSHDVKLVPRLNNNLLLLLLLNSSRRHWKILLSNSFAIQQKTDKRKKTEGWQLPLDP
jgi:hypothetical protein